MIEFTIREMKTEDLKESVYLIEKVIIISNSNDYPGDIIKNLLVHYSLPNFKKMFTRRKYYVALVKDKIVGTAAYENNTIYSLFVDPDYQNNGIGKSLLRKIEECISANDYNKAILSASLTAVPFYKQNGYFEVDRLENQELGNVILMEKNLCK